MTVMTIGLASRPYDASNQSSQLSASRPRPALAAASEAFEAMSWLSG